MNWKYLLLGTIVLFFGTVSAEDTLRVGGFKGMNTTSVDEAMDLRESRVAWNVDFSRGGVGSISKRKGYDSVSAISTGYDSLVNMFPISLNDGRRFLVDVRDSASVGYGGIYYTADGSRNIGSPAYKLPVKWNCEQPTSMGQLDDYLYFANGMQRQIIHDPTIPYTSEFPVYASGEPAIIPIQSSASTYKLGNGEYRYLFTVVYWSGGSYAKIHPGIASPVVRSINGRMLISGFQNIFRPTNIASSVDSSWLMVYRTKVNPGPLSDIDTFFLVSTIPARAVLGYSYPGYKLPGVSLKGGTYYGQTFTDSLPDDSIGNWVSSVTDSTRYWSSGPSQLVESYAAGLALKTTAYTATPAPKYGAAFIANDSSIATNTTFCGGYPKLKDTGWAYYVTYLDTVLGIESDTSRACIIYPTTPAKQKLVQLSLPQPPEVSAGLVKNIYRAPIMKVSADSTFDWNDSVTIISISRAVFVGIEFAKQTVVGYRWQKRTNTITVLDSSWIGIPRRISQVAAVDTIFNDTLSFDSANHLDAYEPNYIPSPLDKIFIFENRLAGVKGSQLYLSKRNEPTGWAAFDVEAVQAGDGDQITAAWSTRTAIRLKKNFASFNWDDDVGKSEVSGFIGCIAPQSHSQSPFGDYFLSGKGVVLETEGQYLERTFNERGVSGSLKNFDNLSLATKQKAASIYLPVEQKYLLSIGDSTYVWDERAEAWSIWSLKFGGAFLYDTSSVISFVPGQNMHFFQRGGRTLFQYGSSEHDKGAVVTMKYQSAAMLIADGGYKQINGVGVRLKSTDTSASLYTGLLNEKGISQVSVSIDNPALRYYRRFSMPQNSFLYGYLFFQSGVNDNLATTTITGFDIYWQKYGDVGIEK